LHRHRPMDGFGVTSAPEQAAPQRHGCGSVQALKREQPSWPPRSSRGPATQRSPREADRSRPSWVAGRQLLDGAVDF
jgi:hypothetical protein